MSRKTTSTQPNDDRPAPEEMTFEQATEELESIIERIESGEIGLESSLVERKRGEALIKRCRAVLDTAEQEIEHLDLSAESDEQSTTRKLEDCN